jgi:1,2-phenylacetyl-CoA epoxidase PaaB subunit
MSTANDPKALKEWPLWEVFVRSKQGLEHTSTAAACTPATHSTRCRWRATCTRAARRA